MKLNKIFFLILLICVGCFHNQKQVNLNNFYGDWAESPEQNVSFTLKKNGVIKYFEDNDIYHYNIKNNELVIKEEGHLIAKYKILIITPDSLRLKTEEGNLIQLVKRR